MSGQPISGTEPAIQRRGLDTGQLERLHTGRVEQRNTRQGVGVDAIGLGVLGQITAQVG